MRLLGRKVVILGSLSRAAHHGVDEKKRASAAIWALDWAIVTMMLKQRAIGMGLLRKKKLFSGVINSRPLGSTHR